jgi:hypothetical protein
MCLASWGNLVLNHSRVIVELEGIINTCFVVMPFQTLFESEYEKVIKPAIESAGLVCVRGDEIYTRQTIVEDIWRSMRRARVVVAELSGRNPNVMYEIGLAHAIGKPIVLITRNEDDVPFDLRALRYVFYDLSEPDWGTYLRKELTDILKLILENPSLGVHLGGIRVETTLPAAPVAPPTPESPPNVILDLSGVWQGMWLSVQRERKHNAVLIIPMDHGSSFTASMTVTYEREGQQTIVQETLSAILDANALTLTGVNYTYIQQGLSRGYSLDRFLLTSADDGRTLVGKAVLRHGERRVSFARVQGYSSVDGSAKPTAA